MQGNTLNLHTLLTFGVGLKGQILKLCRSKYIFITLSTKTYLTGVCYDLDNTEGELQLCDLCFVIYMFLSNNPSSGDIHSSNLSCCSNVQRTIHLLYSRNP